METTDIDHDRILDTFLAETEEQLAEMEALVALEAQPEDSGALQAIFRAAHTLKGNAASMGFAAVAELAHALEDLLDRLRAHTLGVSDRIITLLLQLPVPGGNRERAGRVLPSAQRARAHGSVERRPGHRGSGPAGQPTLELGGVLAGRDPLERGGHPNVLRA